jgi:hypothetical protein
MRFFCVVPQMGNNIARRLESLINANTQPLCVSAFEAMAPAGSTNRHTEDFSPKCLHQKCKLAHASDFAQARRILNGTPERTALHRRHHLKDDGSTMTQFPLTTTTAWLTAKDNWLGEGAFRPALDELSRLARAHTPTPNERLARQHESGGGGDVVSFRDLSAAHG